MFTVLLLKMILANILVSFTTIRFILRLIIAQQLVLMMKHLFKGVPNTAYSSLLVSSGQPIGPGVPDIFVCSWLSSTAIESYPWSYFSDISEVVDK